MSGELVGLPLVTQVGATKLLLSKGAVEERLRACCRGVEIEPFVELDRPFVEVGSCNILGVAGSPLAMAFALVVAFDRGAI
jgi:hypothetical protein